MHRDTETRGVVRTGVAEMKAISRVGNIEKRENVRDLGSNVLMKVG